MSCRRDTSPTSDWFQCHHGTVGCPRFHEGISPHCIECAVGGECRFGHDPPGLPMTLEEYAKAYPDVVAGWPSEART